MLIRTTIAVALIFAYSPLREGGSAPTAPQSVPLPPDLRPALTAERPPESIADLLAAGSSDAARAHEVWSTLPEEARADLARLVARELGEAISR